MYFGIGRGVDVSIVPVSPEIDIFAPQNESLTVRVMKFLRGLVLGGPQLHQQHPLGSARKIQVGAVKQKVGEYDDVPLFGLVQGILFRVDVVVKLGVLLELAYRKWSELVASWVNAENTVFGGRVVHVDEHIV